MGDHHNYEYIIAGGGILGSATAFSLARKLHNNKSPVNLAVLDIDLEGEYSSTLKNAGGVRSTWRNSANIELCNYSIRFYETIADIIDFRQSGYFWLHNPASWDEIVASRSVYDDYGIDIEFYPREDIRKYLPFVDFTEDVSGLSIARNAGLIDHYSLREFYRRNAREYGVDFIDRRYITGLVISDKKVEGIVTKDVTDLIRDKGHGEIVSLLKGISRTDELMEVLYKCNCFINTAGAWSDRLVGTEHRDSDLINPRRRQMILVDCPDLDLSNYGMIIDTSDVYFHREGEYILLGYSDMDEPYGTNFNFDYYDIEVESPFVQKIWKPLSKRISRFEKLKFIRGWSGIYGETPDRSGFLGQVGNLENVYECCAHTGRGLMISYGAGEALADLVADGKIRDELINSKNLSRYRPCGPLYEQLHL